jgi:hypothetical protein
MSDGSEVPVVDTPNRRRGATFAGETATAVTRDGIEQHYTFFEIPLNGVRLDLRLELKKAQVL